MKIKYRSLLALLLCAALLLPAVPAAAGESYPESPHPYANGETNVQRYTCPDAERGVFVTFSEDTWVEPYEARFIAIPKDHTEFTVGDIFSHWVRSGDYIAILDAERHTVGTYSGDELAGKTVYVPTAAFEVLLDADGETNGYGYRVTDVRAAAKEDVRVLTYHDGADGRSETALAPRSEDGYFRYECEFGRDTVARDGFAFSGWSTVPGGSVVYDPGGDIPAGLGDLDLWAVWTPLCLKSDEVLSFSNSSWYFERGDLENYYLSAEDYRAMQLNLYKTYGLGPVPGPALSIVLATYPDWEFRGSCYGMSAVVALQHLGVIDLVSERGVSSLSEIPADDEMISRVNYYQSQAATSWLTEEKAYNAGSAVYRAQLQKLFESVSNGGMALFTFYPEEAQLNTGHTVLFTGAYTRADGSHVLVAYDCNDNWTYLESEYESRFVISPDFSSVTDDWDDPVGAFNWTDSYDQFIPFDASVKGSPLIWYRALLRHILAQLETLRVMFARLTAK